MPLWSNEVCGLAMVARFKLTSRALALFTGLLAPVLLHGCAAVVVAGVAAGAAVVHDRRSSGTVLADDMIEIQAMNLLHKHLDIAGRSNISINSYNLVALLTGQAESSEVSDRFADMVAGLPKVEKVVNEVTVGPSLGLTESSHDVYLASRCKLAIADVNIPGFDPLRVQVVSSSGKVYLRGLVTSEEAAAAVEQVRYVPGVTQVVKLFEYIQKPA
jgi:osmotically-inducible protein OsmY